MMSVSFYLNSQVNKNNTNIDLSKISPKWHYVNSVSTTQNDEIKFVDSINLWDMSYSKTNPLLIYKNNDGLLVNYYTIRDAKEICPEGFRIPLISDFDQLLKTNIFTFNKNSIDSKSFILYGNQSILRGSEESNGIYSYFDDENKLRYWVLNDYSFNESGKAISFTRNANSDFPILNENKPYVVSVLDKKSGLNLYCVEKIEYLFNDTVISYNELVPVEFSKLKNTLSELLINSNIKNFNFTGTLRFDSLGKNVSDGFRAIDNIENQILYNSIKKTISNWSVYPYYNDIKVKSYLTLNISYQSTIDEIYKKAHYTNRVHFSSNFYDKSLLSEIQKCDQGKRHFKYKSELKTNLTIINTEVISRQNDVILKKMIGKGPVYSIYSVLPGLGKMQITKNSFVSHDVSYIRKQNLYLGTSITLGIIGSVSKLISNYYYAQYRADFTNKNYNIANFTQKVFLSSLATYSIMFVYDFSSTFALGIGNKTLQRKVNKKIRNLENPIIIIIIN